MIKVAMIGECMVESIKENGQVRLLGFAGDTANTAIYFARAMSENCKVAYVTALGDDADSLAICEYLKNENIDTASIRFFQGRHPGSYLIENDAHGERQLTYDRASAPAREMFDGAEGLALLEKLLHFDVWYFSGITLAIMKPESQSRFIAALHEAKKRRIKLCFDTNYRSRLWLNHKTAVAEINKVLPSIDMALVSFADEQQLYGDVSPHATIKRLQASGVSEIVVKQSEKTVWILCDDKVMHFEPVPIAHVVDSTSAGDSFNAAYLAARLMGRDPLTAAKNGAELAGKVIQHRGAILPK